MKFGTQFWTEYLTCFPMIYSRYFHTMLLILVNKLISVFLLNSMLKSKERMNNYMILGRVIELHMKTGSQKVFDYLIRHI